MIELTSLGSGSKGNAHLLRAGDTLLLIDCGFTLRELRARLGSVGVDPADIHAVLISHEHADHVRGLGPLLRRYRLPVYLSHGSWHGLRDQRFEQVHCISPHAPFTIGDCAVEPFPVPHDAREPCQFRFAFAGRRVGVMTDIGHVTPHLIELAAACDGLLIESNHDPQMLRDGPYPWPLQERIRNGYGHLSNRAAAELLARLDGPRLQFVALGHLSESNNRPEVARDTCLDDNPGLAGRLEVLPQRRGAPAMAVV